MRTLLLTLLLTIPVSAQEPKSVDALAQRVTELRAKRAEIDKQEAQALADLRAELARIRELVEKLDAGPAPKPPQPKPPEPADPLRTKLRAAFDADPAQLDVRRGHALDLAALYREAAKLASDPNVGTSGDLLTRVREAGRALVGADALRGVRQAAGAELGALLPTDAPLSEEQRKAAAALFGKLAQALEEIAK